MDNTVDNRFLVEQEEVDILVEVVVAKGKDNMVLEKLADNKVAEENTLVSDRALRREPLEFEVAALSNRMTVATHLGTCYGSANKNKKAS